VPIDKLFVEGNLESEVLNPILAGNPVLQQGGSKNSLKPRARSERRENRVVAGYLRDRDFDFDPPQELSRPTVDSEDDGLAVGWRWCRHEIENYLIDPLVVRETTGWPIPDFEEALRQSARKIRGYEAARWTVGIVRRALPPHYDLKTRPQGLNELEVPQGLDFVEVRAWASINIQGHRERIVAETDPAVVEASIEDFYTRFGDDFVADISNVLLWFSGKDLLAGMADWLATRAISHPGALRASLRDWVIANPMRTLELLPEWSGLTQVLRT
jgi:hypothetical protein